MSAACLGRGGDCRAMRRHAAGAAGRSRLCACREPGQLRDAPKVQPAVNQLWCQGRDWAADPCFSSLSRKEKRLQRLPGSLPVTESRPGPTSARACSSTMVASPQQLGKSSVDDLKQVFTQIAPDYLTDRKTGGNNTSQYQGHGRNSLGPGMGKFIPAHLPGDSYVDPQHDTHHTFCLLDRDCDSSRVAHACLLSYCRAAVLTPTPHFLPRRVHDFGSGADVSGRQMIGKTWVTSAGPTLIPSASSPSWGTADGRHAHRRCLPPMAPHLRRNMMLGVVLAPLPPLTLKGGCVILVTPRFLSV